MSTILFGCVVKTPRMFWKTIKKLKYIKKRVYRVLQNNVTWEITLRKKFISLFIALSQTIFIFICLFLCFRYLLIMPTLLKIYSNHQTNKLITTTIEYAVKQFYLMNRKPFILQMFGSVSAMLDTDEDGTYGDAHKVLFEGSIYPRSCNTNFLNFFEL